MLAKQKRNRFKIVHAFAVALKLQERIRMRKAQRIALRPCLQVFGRDLENLCEVALHGESRHRHGGNKEKCDKCLFVCHGLIPFAILTCVIPQTKQVAFYNDSEW